MFIYSTTNIFKIKHKIEASHHLLTYGIHVSVTHYEATRQNISTPAHLHAKTSTQHMQLKQLKQQIKKQRMTG